MGLFPLTLKRRAIVVSLDEGGGKPKQNEAGPIEAGG